MSCDDYLDVNTDTDNPSIDQVSPDLMLAGAQTTTGDMFVTRMNQLGNVFSGSWGGNVVQFAGPFDQEFRYNVTNTFYNDIWDTMYIRTANFTYILDYTGNSKDYTRHHVAARVMRAFYFQYLVDIYGDLPYFGKHQLTDNLQVSYDSSESIYADLVSELNIALNQIANMPAGAEAMGTEDVTFGGDMEMWRKFANTIKLRILLRQSGITTGNTQTYIADELSGLTNADFLSAGENATMNPGYVNETGKQNSFYATYGFEANGNVRNGNNSVVGSEYLIELLKGTNTGVPDGRLSQLFRTNDAGVYQGIKQGDLLGNLPAGTTLSKLGAGLGVDQSSDANATRASYLMTSSESLFLQAEATERGYLTGATAESLFDLGVSQSFSLLGATQGTYLTQINGIVGLDYTGSFDNKLEGIITQKWLALSGTNGIESWIEMTRTGYPSTPLTETQTSGAKPIRLIYPISELSGNTANVPSQNTNDVFTSNIFWDVN